jgi:deoxycytidylate deaminase
MHRYVNLAKALFRRGATSHGRTFNVCFAVKKSQVIAIGLNDYDRDMSGYNRQLKTVYKKYGEKTYVPSLHAEISSILKIGIDDCSALSFYCIRLDKKCHCQNSQPCANCMRMLRIVKAKNVYFYDKEMQICEAH